jgi:hypothetical protein
MFFECPSHESKCKFYITKQKEKVLWRDHTDAGVKCNRPPGMTEVMEVSVAVAVTPATYVQLVGTYLQRGHKHGYHKRKIMLLRERVSFSDKHIVMWTAQHSVPLPRSDVTGYCSCYAEINKSRQRCQATPL